jgi:hypothetical protein
VISILVVPGWRVHVSEARAGELVGLGWVVELVDVDGGEGPELVVTAEGARELLALVDPRALDSIARHIEGGRGVVIEPAARHGAGGGSQQGGRRAPGSRG